MRGATKRRARLFLWFLFGGTLAGVIYGGLANLTVTGQLLMGGLVGAIDGATITIVIASIEIFLLATRPGQSFEQTPFLVTLGPWRCVGPRRPSRSTPCSERRPGGPAR